MAFVKYEPKQSKKAGPQVRIRPTGLISFNATAVDKFGLENFSYATLYFDPEEKTIGLKPAAEKSDSSSLKLSHRQSTAGLKAPGFFKHFQIPLNRTITLDVARDDEGILNFVMKGIRRRRIRKAK